MIRRAIIVMLSLVAVAIVARAPSSRTWTDIRLMMFFVLASVLAVTWYDRAGRMPSPPRVIQRRMHVGAIVGLALGLFVSAVWTSLAFFDSVPSFVVATAAIIVFFACGAFAGNVSCMVFPPRLQAVRRCIMCGCYLTGVSASTCPVCGTAIGE